MSDAIQIDGLSKAYAGQKAIHRLNLQVPTGSIFALLGDNGAGKTTTIKILTGQEQPDAGSASILGHDCWTDADVLRHRVGYVPERPRYYDWMTVREIGWFVGGFHRDGFRERFREAAAELGLDFDKRLKSLSKGGYARIGLALAMAVDPEVLILDEPTSGLDLLTRREFLANMVNLAGVGRTVLICSHQIAEVERIASHVAFLSDGQLISTGTLDAIKADSDGKSHSLEEVYARLMSPTKRPMVTTPEAR